MQVRAILDICYKFGVLCDLKFNCVKSIWGLAGRLCGSGVVEFELGGIVAPRYDAISDLRKDFTFDSSLGVEDYEKLTKKFIAAVNPKLLHKVFDYESLVSAFLISKCLSILSFGLNCLILDSKN